MNSVLRVITAYDYECIIAVDIPTGYFKTHTGGSHCILLPEQGDLEEQVRSAADCFVLPEDRQEYLEKMSLPAIIRTLEGQQRPSFTYRRRKPSGEIVWIKVSFLYASEDKEQVTAVLSRTHILGQLREIQGVRNAFSAYEHLETCPHFLAKRHSCGPCHTDGWPFVKHLQKEAERLTVELGSELIN